MAGRNATSMQMRAALAALLLLLLAGCNSASGPTENASATMEETAADETGSAAPLPAPAPAPDRGPASEPAMTECEATGTSVSQEACDAYRQLRPAAGAFNAPDQLNRGQTVRVRFALSREPDKEAARAEASSAVAALPGEKVVIDTRVGRHMRATLTATPGLDVKALSEERQDLGLAGVASWDWDVTANDKASPDAAEVLTLTTFVELPGADGSVQRLWQKIENRQIRVNVTQGQRFADAMDESEGWFKRGNNWIIALTALIASLSALWLAIRKFGRKD